VEETVYFLGEFYSVKCYDRDRDYYLEVGEGVGE
jgi:hypothetical protein